MNCGTPSNSLAYVKLEFTKERREAWDKKSVSRNYGKIFLNLIKTTIFRSKELKKHEQTQE